MAKSRPFRYGGSYRGAYIIPVPHIGHQDHLCELIQRGDLSLEEMKYLIKNPKFICKKCGRVAAKQENLCEPTTLE